MKVLETKRLILRPFQLDDSEAMFDYAKREDVGPNAGWKPHENIDETRQVIESFMEKNEVYAIELRETKTVIGSLGVHYRTLGQFGDVYELGYVLHPNYHRRGIMTEAVKEILEYFFVSMDQEMIYVGHFEENTPSRKLIEKMGFKWVEDIEYQSKDYGMKHSKIYRLSKLDFALMKEKK